MLKEKSLRKKDSLQDTLYLASIPGMVESIIEGTKEPLLQCSQELEFWPKKQCGTQKDYS